MEYPNNSGPGYGRRMALRQDAAFIGAAFLLMLALLRTALTVVLLLLAVLGVADLQAADGRYGMGDFGFLTAYMAAYILIMALPGPLAALFTQRKIHPLSRYDGYNTEGTALRFSSLFPALLGGLAICVLANFVTSYLMAFFGLFGIRQPELPSYLEPTVPSLLYNILIFAVLPGILEELLFRGYFLRVLRPYGGRFAIVTTALLFGLMHGNILQIPFAFLVGLACGWLALRTGRVWPAMLLHFLNNFMAQVLQYVGLRQTVEQSQKTLLIVFCAVGILGLIALLFLYARNDPMVRDKADPPPAMSLGERVGALFSSALFLSAIVVAAFFTMLSVLTTQMGGGA